MDGKGIGKGGVWYIDFGEVIEKRGTWRLWLGGEVEGSKAYRLLGENRKVKYIKATESQMICVSVIYTVSAVREIKSE